MATMLENSKCKLKCLGLWFGLVDDKGMHILADAMSVNKKLRYFDLWGEDGVCKALLSNTYQYINILI